MLPPGYIGNPGYLFFVASGVEGVNRDIGTIVLTSFGPDKNGQWSVTLADGYGNYQAGNGAVFLAPTQQGQCPDLAQGDTVIAQDQTFDLGYAAPGSIFKDPASAAGRLLMVYEGTNACVATPGGPRLKDGSYEVIGVATSLDGGRSWPRYASNARFTAFDLPFANPSQGPHAPEGAFGGQVCIGNICTNGVPATYGRYRVLSPPKTLDSLMQAAIPLAGNLGNSEPSAFLDDVQDDRTTAPYVYVVFEYLPGTESDEADKFADHRAKDLMVARAQITADGSPLVFGKWNGSGFGGAGGAGEGGLGAQILPDGHFQDCGLTGAQERSQGSISYVMQTHQYLLTFVCNSPGDPVSGNNDPTQQGSAWFYSVTDDLSTQSWSDPTEIVGSFAVWTNNTGDGCPVFNGWYPNFMSLEEAPGRLTLRGHVFYMWGSLGACNTPGVAPPNRRYESRQFTIVTAKQ